MRVILFSLCLGLFVFTQTSVHANQPRIALVIGNSNYEDAPLANPARDAALMAETLREVGFEVLEYNDLDRRDLTRAFLTLGEKLEQTEGNATALVYYAGHGAQVNGENYLIPVGAKIVDEIDVEIEGVRASSLLRTLRKAESSLNIVILDACRNNPFESASRSASQGLAKMDAPTGTLLAYSTAPGKVAEDGSGNNSTYTRALARAIKTPGAKVEEVFKTVRVNVVDRTQGRQVPWESSSLTGDFIFQEKLPEPEPVVTAAASAVDTTQIEIEYWKSIANSTDPAMFEAYLADYPEGIFKSIAEQRVASLNTALIEPEPDDGFAREQAVWNSIKDSGNIGMLQGFLETYPDGAYATIARATIANLETQQQSTSQGTRAVDQEFVIWDSVKDAATVSELQVYLDAYPNGKYANIAKARIASLSATVPQTNAVHPYQGKWQFELAFESSRGSLPTAFCSPGAKIDTEVSIDSSGSFEKVVESNKQTKQTISGNVDDDGTLQFNLVSWAGSRGPSGEVRLPFPEGEKSNRLKMDSAYVDCIYRMTLNRIE